MSKFIQRNINELKRLKQNNTKNSSKATVKRVDEIIDYILKEKYQM